jgi:uncharacterized membrane protein
VVSRLRLRGRPVHPVFVMFPLGLFITAVIFDVADVAGGPALLGETAYWTIAAGLIGGGLVVVASLINYVAIPRGTRVWQVANTHALVTLVVIVIFAASWAVRRTTENHAADGWLFMLQFAALAAGGLSVRLGGELVDRFGVDSDADLDGPPSLETGVVTRNSLLAR